ncbi:MAG: hypothetical protein ACYCYP_12385 [Leptospirales bacterium]
MIIVKIASGFLFLLLGSALFSHTAERLVHRLFQNRQAGSRILGNLSLSLPEAILPLYAFLIQPAPSGPSSIHSAHFSMNIGVGAILGAPAFLLLALWPAYLWITRKVPLVETRRTQLGRETPLLFFALAIALTAGVVPSRPFHLFVGCLLIGLYLGAFFLIETPSNPTPDLPGEDSLPPSPADYLLFLVSIVLILVGPEIFLSGLNALGASLRSSLPFFLSMGLSALATESPEALALFFLLRRKERDLGFDIVWGSVSFQMTVSLSIGLLLSPWHLLKVHLLLGGTLLLALLASFLFAKITPSTKG